ncbi:MAG: hypothetical protein K2J72_10125, partial [Oscillospiraceae bacterium]|nr:hypothetical protein [Oscillospiraceae bacterium]
LTEEHLTALRARISPTFMTAGGADITLAEITERGEYALIPVIASGVMPEVENYTVTLDEEVGRGVLIVGGKDFVALKTGPDGSSYRFLFEEVDEYGWSYRTTYEEKGYVHGVYDAELESSVLGEIAPNTTINVFLSNFEEDSIAKLTLYDHLGNVVFTAGALYGDFQEKGDEVFVGTGWRMENGENGSYDVVYLSILGDVDGDGFLEELGTDVNDMVDDVVTDAEGIVNDVLDVGDDNGNR